MADEHRTWARSPRLRRVDDPTASSDPAISAVMAQLDELARAHATITPRPEFRAELRAQLVAITPRIVAEHAPANGGVEIVGDAAPARVAVLDRPRPTPRPRAEESAARPTPREPRESFWQKLREIPIGRPLGIVASMVTVLALVLGGAVWMSRDSVPGDTLYGLKRASERVELSFADNDTERAQDYLDFAATRVDEARELASRASSSAAGTGLLADGRLNSETSGLITDALRSADGNTQTAARLLGNVAVDKASPGPLDSLTSWAPDQLDRLAKLRAAVPSGTEVSTATGQSSNLVTAARNRAASLQQKVDCDCLQNAPTDSLGPLPVAVPSPGRTTTPPKSSTPQRSTTPGGSTTNPGSRNRTGAPTGNPTSSTPRRLPLPLPSLKLPTPQQPTTTGPNIDLCKVNLLGVRLCPSPSK